MVLCSKIVAISQDTILNNMYEFIQYDIFGGEILVTSTTIRSFFLTRSSTDFSTPILMSEQCSVVEGKLNIQGCKAFQVEN